MILKRNYEYAVTAYEWSDDAVKETAMDFSDEFQEWVRPPDWESLPTVVLVKIFHFLPLQQRLSARYVYSPKPPRLLKRRSLPFCVD